MSNQNLVIETYKGIDIRKSNVIRFRVGANKFKELIDAVEETGLSIPKIIAMSSRPCDKCKGLHIIAYSSSGDEIKIKKGVLCDYTIMNSGVNIIEQSKHKK